MAKNSILINCNFGETRVALIEDGILAELYLERPLHRSPVGNIYIGKVTRVLPGMQAAFVDIGLERAAFLHVEDVITGQEPSPDDEEETKRRSRSNRRLNKKNARKTPIREVLSEGQDLVVQVSKGPIGTKGARVTAHVSLPGRYVVYMPTTAAQIGVSKRIGNDQERRRLKEVIDTLRPPEGGIVVRTMGQGLTKSRLKADIGYLVHTWEETLKAKKATKKSPSVLHEEPDVIIRAARDMLTDEVEKIVIDDREQFERLKAFVEMFLPERAGDLELYEGSEPFFDEYGVEDEIDRGLARKIGLPSGGHVVIDRAEALTAIDVNTGRYTGRGKNVEDTILETNLEAVKEICAQLRFRNIGGIIVLDFIDMDRSAHREKVYRELQKQLKKDKAKTTTVRISDFGLVEMTRKRSRESLGRTVFEPCFYCDGTGQLRSKRSVCRDIFRQIRRDKDYLAGYGIRVRAHPAVCDMLGREEKEALEEAQNEFQRRIQLEPHSDYHIEQFDLSGA